MRKFHFAGLYAFCLVALLPALARAAEAAGEGDSSRHMMMFAVAIGSGLGLGLAAFGGSLGQARAAAAALEGIARNPGAAGKLLTPMILGLAFIESLVIYSFLVSFLLYLKL